MPCHRLEVGGKRQRGKRQGLCQEELTIEWGFRAGGDITTSFGPNDAAAKCPAPPCGSLFYHAGKGQKASVE